MSRADARRAQYRKALHSQGGLFGKTGYGSNFGFDARGLDALSGTDYIKDPSKYIFSDTAYAPTNEYESAGFQARGYIGSGRGARRANIFMFQKKQPQTPTTKIEYRDNPEQAKQIAELQKQLKILQDVPKYEPYDFSKEKAEYEERISGLNERIGTIQSGYKTQLEDLTTSMRAEREAAEKALGLKFSDQLSAQQKSSAERLAAQQAQSAAQLGELKDMYTSQLGQAALQRQTLQKSLQQQQQASAANQLKFQEALSAQQQTAAADRLKFTESLAAQQSAAQKEFEALRGTMSQQRQQYEAGLAAERAAAEQARQEQAMSFQRSLAQQRSAPQVEGIRFATRGPAAQKSMQGISGTFGRRGGRLMKISALNV